MSNIVPETKQLCVPCSAEDSEIPLLPNFFGLLLPEVVARSLNCCCTVVESGGQTESSGSIG